MAVSQELKTISEYRLGSNRRWVKVGGAILDDKFVQVSVSDTKQPHDRRWQALVTNRTTGHTATAFGATKAGAEKSARVMAGAVEQKK
jgi:hypothetical protein